MILLNKNYYMDDNQINKIIVSTIMNNSDDTFYFKDKQSKIILSSIAHAALWGEENPKDVVGKTDFDYFPEEFAIMAFNIEKEIMNTQTPMLGIVEKLNLPDGKIKWLLASKYPLYDDELNIMGTWGTTRDITPLKETELELERLNKSLEKANKKLKILSSKDSLTGLYNQGHFIEESEKIFNLFKRRKEKKCIKSFSIIVLDVDDLKTINDTYGHLMGDYLLKEISETILTRVRSSDKFFRIGGDEFAIILHDTTLEDATIMAEEIQCLIANTNINYMDNKIRTTISVGASSFYETDSIEDMRHLADERLYDSKRESKRRLEQNI